VNVLILRAGSLFENFYDMLGLIKQQGITGGAAAPDRGIRPRVRARVRVGGARHRCCLKTQTVTAISLTLI
jgi:hypothetical protein